MGREVKRVDAKFVWPLNEIWWGYLLESVPCGACCAYPDAKSCRTCYGEGTVYPKVEPPLGAGWQMWETVSEGSPISPVFSAPEELARWLADTKASAFGDMTATYEQWLGMISEGSSVAMVIDRGVMKSGVAAAAEHVAQRKD